MRTTLTTLLLAAVGVLLSSTTRADLVAHYQFNEGSGTTVSDSSTGGNNGTATATMTWGSDATRASFGIFNGTDASVTTGYMLPTMTLTQDYTWAFFTQSKQSAAPPEQNVTVIGNRYNATGGDNTPREFIKFTSTQFEYRPNDVGTSIDYADLVQDQWHHHAVVKTGASLQYYFDGVATGAPLVQTASFAAGTAFFMGGDPGGPTPPRAGEHYNGFLDDVRLYNNALSSAQVLALATTAIPEPNSLAIVAIGALGLIARRKRR